MFSASKLCLALGFMVLLLTPALCFGTRFWGSFFAISTLDTCYRYRSSLATSLITECEVIYALMLLRPLNFVLDLYAPTVALPNVPAAQTST